MPDREQEPVLPLPVRVIGAVPQLVHVHDREDVGDPQRLADVVLALYLTYVQGIVPDPIRRVPRRGAAVGAVAGGGCPGPDAVTSQCSVGGL